MNEMNFDGSARSSSLLGLIPFICIRPVALNRGGGCARKLSNVSYSIFLIQSMFNYFFNLYDYIQFGFVPLQRRNALVNIL